MNETDNVGVAVADFRVVIRKFTSTSLWRDARAMCDEALAQGLAFVAILRDMDSFGDGRWLNDQDRQRAARFRIARDKNNFVLGRTMVHQLVRPKDASPPCTFAFEQHGKPFMVGCPAYNLSHSANWVACAVARPKLVGVDIETFARLRDYRELLEATTHPAEHLSIHAAAPDRRLALFQRCWTRKEAVLKATGKGLSDDLRTIDVRLHEAEPVLDDPARLRLVDLRVGDDRVSASVALDVSLGGVIVMLVT